MKAITWNSSMASEKLFEFYPLTRRNFLVNKIHVYLKFAFCFDLSPMCTTEAIFDEFHRMVTGELDEENDPNELGRLKIFAGVREFPVRVKCASLAWHTLKAALNEEGRASTE